MKTAIKLISLISLPVIFSSFFILSSCETKGTNDNDSGVESEITGDILIKNVTANVIANTHTKTFGFSQGEVTVNIGANVYVGEDSKYTFELDTSNSDIVLAN